MEANPNFQNMPIPFWGHVRLLSEKIGYAKRRSAILRYYKMEEAEKLLLSLNIEYDMGELTKVIEYMNYRAEVLNESVSKSLMYLDDARDAYNKARQIYDKNHYTCAIPMNKQKSEKQNPAYFTAIINILAEHEMREISQARGLKYGTDIRFDDDPRNLSYILDENNKVVFTLSRRFDGAIPSTANPKAIWEIKEYYYTTTFGRRVADGVYETLLDGFETNLVENFYNSNFHSNRKLKHFYFLDDKRTWWDMGKSYLCRIIDMLNMGFVDNVIFGREVFEEWPLLIREIWSS